MISAIIIDDEQRSRQVIADKLKIYCPNVEITAIAESADQGKDLIEQHKPDLIFLDIAMPEKDGFTMLTEMPELNFEIIFVTGFDQYAITAIRFCAIGYILKPVQTEELVRAVHNAAERIIEKKENQRNRQLIHNITNIGDSENRIGIPTQDGLELIPVKQIIRCEGVRKCTKIHLLKAKPLISSYNLGEYVTLLQDYNFFSVHKSHLINLKLVKKYSKAMHVIMVDDSAVPVSRRKKSALLDHFDRI